MELRQRSNLNCRALPTHTIHYGQLTFAFGCAPCNTPMQHGSRISYAERLWRWKLGDRSTWLMSVPRCPSNTPSPPGWPRTNPVTSQTRPSTTTHASWGELCCETSSSLNSSLIARCSERAAWSRRESPDHAFACEKIAPAQQPHATRTRMGRSIRAAHIRYIEARTMDGCIYCTMAERPKGVRHSCIGLLIYHRTIL